MFEPRDAALVNQIRSVEASGQPLDGAFSRRRSFRRGLKKAAVAATEAGTSGAAAAGSAS
jgi:hypothetical protein